MKRFLLWLISVALGVVVLLAAVMGVSYAFTTEGGCPDDAAQFGGQALEANGSCWQVPLLGGKLDKVFASPATLSVQKLGVLYTAHPELTLPDWTCYTALTIQNTAGDVLFAGSAGEYQNFLFPANGEYKAELTAWRVPKGGVITQFEGGSTGQLRKNLGLERPAKPTGWYRYSFRFTLQASAEVELSAERVEQGGTVGVRISGMTGDAVPTIETDLGSVQCVRAAEGWRAYIPAAYNASSGGHEINITVNGETITRTLTVLPKDFGTAEVEAEEPAPESANAQFRSAIWPLYEAAATAKQWQGGFVPPRRGFHDFGGLRTDQGNERPAGQPLQFHKAVHHPRCALPRRSQRHGGVCGKSGTYRQHGGHRPRLRAAQLSVRLAGAFGQQGTDRGKGTGCGCTGRRADHGLQAGQQEREPASAVPDLRRAVLEGKWLSRNI